MTEAANNLHHYGVWYFACWIQVLDQIADAALVYVVWKSDDINKLVQRRGLQPVLVCFSAHMIHRAGYFDRSLLCRSFGGCHTIVSVVQPTGDHQYAAYR